MIPNIRCHHIIMTKIIHKELSYTVRGVLFDVHNQLGSVLPEQFYQDAIAIGLEAKGIACQTEKVLHDSLPPKLI